MNSTSIEYRPAACIIIRGIPYSDFSDISGMKLSMYLTGNRPLTFEKRRSQNFQTNIRMSGGAV